MSQQEAHQEAYHKVSLVHQQQIQALTQQIDQIKLENDSVIKTLQSDLQEKDLVIKTLEESVRDLADTKALVEFLEYEIEENQNTIAEYQEYERLTAPAPGENDFPAQASAPTAPPKTPFAAGASSHPSGSKPETFFIGDTKFQLNQSPGEPPEKEAAAQASPFGAPPAETVQSVLLATASPHVVSGKTVDESLDLKPWATLFQENGC